MASTKRICGAVIKKLKFKKIIYIKKKILGAIAFIIDLRILAIDIK